MPRSFPLKANISLKGAKIDYKRRMLDGSIPGRVRELLPVFDAAGFCKLPPPTSKLIKPPRS
ncbi:GD16789 [Drosophila simulans]|uniref:GD16789 n=1 Tax=Drosophila simulans TaxID=7240 RepID=B4R5E3_DROSI|nr:GD16789 [Drosophila simulans]